MRRSLAVALVGVTTSACSAPAPELPEVEDPIPEIDPTIGTGGVGVDYGSCFVGAAAPHGLVKLGPDTDGPLGTELAEHYSGDYAFDGKLTGFTHLHLHGAGTAEYGVLALMPTLAFSASKQHAADYETAFANQVALAGSFAVTLADGTTVELTATQRVGVERYTLPTAGSIVIDLDRALGGHVDTQSIAIDDGGGEVSGQLHVLGGMSSVFGGYTVYFSLRASTPWTGHQSWATGAELEFPAGATTLAVGVSLVSVAGARANLAAEVPTIDFDSVVTATQNAWRTQLGNVRITGGTAETRTIFYTSLYHAYLAPSVISDVDGSYQLAGQPVAIADGYTQMSDMPLWSSYRTVMPLYAWLDPTSARDMSRSLIAFGAALGAYPRWPVADGDAALDVGAAAEVAIADATARGVADAGGSDAYPALRAAAMDPDAPPASLGGRVDNAAYMQLGYVPSSVPQSVSETIEYSQDDFALAQLAGALGQTADHDALLARSANWQKLYDPQTGFLRARDASGNFADVASFDESAYSTDYEGANARQALWQASLFDANGIANVVGSSDSVSAHLQDFFMMAQADWTAANPAEVGLPRPYYWQGNEPDLDAVFAFAEQARPDLTQTWLAWIASTLYTTDVTGVPGNDDAGTLGAWYVLTALGVYPIAGSDRWVVGAPRFPRARIDVGGHELLIDAEGAGEDGAIQVQSVTLDNGAVGVELTQAQLANGVQLTFQMIPLP